MQGKICLNAILADTTQEGKTGRSREEGRRADFLLGHEENL